MFKLSLRRFVFSGFIIFLVLSSSVCIQPAMASEFQKQLVRDGRDLLRGRIGILYDPSDEVIRQIAWDVFRAFGLANISSSLHEISTTAEVSHTLERNGLWIVVYLFNSHLQNVAVGQDKVKWEDFAQLLLQYRSFEHVLGIGNTRKLAEHLGEDCKNIHLSNTDLVDAKLSFLYSLWTVAEVLEKTKDCRYKEVELDIRRVGLTFFADNFDDLFERALQPKTPLGQEDLIQKQLEFEEMKKRFPQNSRLLPPIPPDGVLPNERIKTGVDVSSLAEPTSVPPPRLYLSSNPGTSVAPGESFYATGLSAASGLVAEDDESSVELLFKVLDIPTKSGVDGPIGSILDYLLENLVKLGGYTSAALGEDAVDRIVDAVNAIKTIIGLAEDAEGGSALKGLFDLIKLEFPVLEEYEKFFDLFVDALYAFRGDLPEIVDWVSDALVVLVDELDMAQDKKETIKASLNEILDLGEEFYDIVRSSENVLESLLSWFLERMLPKVADKLLKDALPGLAPDHLIDGVKKIGSVINAIVKFAVSPDSTSLLESLLSVFEAFGLVYDLGWTAIARIRALVKLVYVVLGYSDEVPDVLNEFIPSTLFTIQERIVNEAYARWSARDHYIFYGGRFDDDSDNGILGDYPHDCGDDNGFLVGDRWRFETTPYLWPRAYISREQVGYNRYKYYDQCTGMGGGSTGTASTQGPCKEHMHLDCSGLVWYCYVQAGYRWPPNTSPRPYGTTRFGGPTAGALRTMCRTIPKEELQPADLCFKPNHVGIYVGYDSYIDKYVIIEAKSHAHGVFRSTYESLSDMASQWSFGTLLRRVEPLYFGWSEHTVNNSPAMELVPKFLVTSGFPLFNFSQRSFVGPTTSQEVPCEVGIRIWRRSPNGAMSEITAGEPVAVVKVNHGFQRVLKQGMWVSPSMQIGSTDNFVVEVFARPSQLFTPGWHSLGSWSTKQLLIQRLEKMTWTVNYNLSYSVLPADDATGWVGTVTFAFGDPRTNSRLIPYLPPAEIPEAGPEEWFSGDVEETVSTSKATTVLAQGNFETTANVISNLVSQIVDDIDRARKQEQTDVIAFGDQIRTRIDDALEQANLTVEEATKQVLVDAIVLVAGVMNPKFMKSSLPTLPAVVRNVLQATTAPTDAVDIIDNVVSNIVAVIALITQDTGIMQAISRTPSDFESQYASMGILVGNTVELTLHLIGVEATTIEEVRSYIDTFATVGQATFNIIKALRENTVQGIIQTIIQGVGFVLTQTFELDLKTYSGILEIAFPEAMGVEPYTPEMAVDFMNEVLQGEPLGLDPNDPADRVTIDAVTNVTYYFAETREVFSNGYRWILNKIMDWLGGKVEELADYLNVELSNILSEDSFFHTDGELALDLGGFTSFGLKYDLALDAGINIRTDELLTFVSSVIFDGYNLEINSTGDVFKTILSFAEITPVFKGSFELTGFGSNEYGFLNTLLESLGVQIQFEGGGHFTLQLLSFKGGAFEPSGFMKVVEWGFHFTIEVSKDFTLLDFLTGGVGGGALSTLSEYIGLDAITITVFFGLTVDVVKRAASPSGPEQATFTLIIEIGAALTVGIDIVIAAIQFYGELKVVFTFAQDLLSDAPMQIFMDLVAQIKVTITLVFEDIDKNWGPKTLYHKDFSADTPEQAISEEPNAVLGFDSDGDGLSDEYEESVPGLRSDLNDTDGDGLTDKEETKTTKTDPINNDTDGDGLLDYEEVYVYSTHPKRVDTDFDGLTDYEETMVYGTMATVMDTDEDGLDDYYEVNHAWDIPANITTSVKEVWIGEVAYDDHTDPLDPDTDDDGLLDGEEGAAGPHYGLRLLYNETNAEANLTKLYNQSDPTPDDNPLIFNCGYTHPLDNDTDDDSYLQLWNGSKALVKGDHVFLRSMTDGEEVRGVWAVFITEGEPNRTLVRTNPCNPDTDGDTGRTPHDVPLDAYLNSDGYELAQNPPTDPTNGDTDHDGLIDGIEGVLKKTSYHTNPTNPDTDGDGLGDMQEILLATDPRNADTDFDLVLDGDEYHRFHTNPHWPDSDYDGLEDYEELFFWHSNPNLRDSDGDGIPDGREVLIHDTDPMDEDTDNDGLGDYDEIFKHGTDPFNPDTDMDKLSDSEEVENYLSDPLNWDTDGDSILYPNEHGNMTWPMSDGDEVTVHGTDPVRTDTDNDGLSDSIELYLGSGRIPHSVLEPIPLNATDADTDGDGLIDGLELRIGNTSNIVYPYLALMPYSYYHTSALMADTDGDGLSDFEEVNGTLPFERSFEAGVAKFNFTGSLPYLMDSDNDTLLDGDEVFIHGTDPLKNDTDGDGLADNEEETLLQTGGTVGYGTNATNSDSDADLLPDGYEVNPNITLLVAQKHGIILDATNPDANGNGLLDGYEIDLDNDGLSDGEEFYVHQTYRSWKKGSAFAGGFLNSDSDGDGLSDGIEVNEFGTDPVKYDTDGDGYSDGAEVAVGTDPVIATSTEEYQSALDLFRAGRIIRIVYPTNTTLLDPTADVRVVNSTEIDAMWFRHNDGSGWSPNYTLQYSTAHMQWEHADIVWPEGSYLIQVFGNKTTGYTVWDQQWFTIIGEEDIQFYKGWSIKTLSPANITIYDNHADIRVVNATEVVNMWCRFDSGNGWLGNYTLSYNDNTGEWENTSIIWPDGLQCLQVFAYTAVGEVVWDEQWFTIAAREVEGELPMQLLLLVLGVVAGSAGTSAAFLWSQKRRRKKQTEERDEK